MPLLEPQTGSQRLQSCRLLLRCQNQVYLKDSNADMLYIQKHQRCHRMISVPTYSTLFQKKKKINSLKPRAQPTHFQTLLFHFSIPSRFTKAPCTQQQAPASQIEFAAGSALAWSAKPNQSIGLEESNAQHTPTWQSRRSRA